MLEKISRTPIEDIPLSSISMPPGCPAWITAEKIRETMWVWQPYSDTPITVDDALEILTNVRELMKAFVEQGRSSPPLPRTTRKERRQNRSRKHRK